MSDSTTTVQSAALGATMTTGLLPVIANNATAISVICTVLFGIIYATCAIWNAVSNHRRNQVNRRKIAEDIIADMVEGGIPHEVIDRVRESIRH